MNRLRKASTFHGPLSSHDREDAIWMIPRLGPVVDIDLFFSVYLTLAFLAGLLLDLEEDEPGALTRPILTAAVLAAASASSSLLVFRELGLP